MRPNKSESMLFFTEACACLPPLRIPQQKRNARNQESAANRLLTGVQREAAEAATTTGSMSDAGHANFSIAYGFLFSSA